MTDQPLSPAAQAVLDAFTGNDTIHGFHLMTPRIAAALRAAADQVVPSDADEPRNSLPMAIECQRIRAELLAIAAELDAE
jgi:hypothetical protein